MRVAMKTTSPAAWPRDHGEESNIRDMKALATSLMPHGLLNALSEQEAKDLMTFLMTAPEREK
jgi:cytochrome c1